MTNIPLTTEEAAIVVKVLDHFETTGSGLTDAEWSTLHEASDKIKVAIL